MPGLCKYDGHTACRLGRGFPRAMLDAQGFAIAPRRRCTAVLPVPLAHPQTCSKLTQRLQSGASDTLIEVSSAHASGMSQQSALIACRRGAVFELDERTARQPNPCRQEHAGAQQSLALLPLGASDWIGEQAGQPFRQHKLG
jgi:hypothetical protein